jgi:hypothetical protein
MSMPPEGGWQPPQQPVPPPNQGQPYGQPFNPLGYNPQPSPPPGWQGPWPQQPGPAPQKGNSLKWLLIAVAVLLVIGISVGATLIFTRDGGSGGQATPTSGAPSDIASAGDTGPVMIITDEPTCKDFVGINNSLGDLQGKGWGADRAALGPVAEWTSDQRVEVNAVATAMRNAAEQAIPLAKQTPHRVVRELYEQFIAYGRAYAESIPNYTPSDDALASANVNASSAIIGICNTITYGSVNRALALAAASSPSQVAPLGDPAQPKPFVTTSGETCKAWVERSSRFNADTAEWENLDSNLPASQWTPERRATEQAVQPLLRDYADQIEAAGRKSGNPALEDFSVAAALYLRAYVTVGDSYTGVDSWLSYTGFRFSNLVESACRYAAG